MGGTNPPFKRERNRVHQTREGKEGRALTISLDIWNRIGDTDLDGRQLGRTSEARAGREYDEHDMGGKGGNGPQEHGAWGQTVGRCPGG